MPDFQDTRTGRDRRVRDGDGDGKITLDSLLKIAQLGVFPILAGMIWLLIEIFGMKANQTSLQYQLANMPRVADKLEELARTVVVIQDRQNSTMGRVSVLEDEVARHRELSTYDKKYQRDPFPTR